jgi:predicted ester cyclase
LVAEGDKVAARFTMRGTHKGIFFGVPPSEKKIEVKAMNLYRITGGQIVEEHARLAWAAAANRRGANLRIRKLAWIVTRCLRND